MVRTPSFCCQGPRFNPWLGKLDPASHMVLPKKKKVNKKNIIPKGNGMVNGNKSRGEKIKRGEDRKRWKPVQSWGRNTPTFNNEKILKVSLNKSTYTHKCCIPFQIKHVTKAASCTQPSRLERKIEPRHTGLSCQGKQVESDPRVGQSSTGMEAGLRGGNSSRGRNPPFSA